MNKEIEKIKDNDAELSLYACKNSDAIRLKKESKDIRPAFFHDADRIIYSPSFTRYIDKTQVFSFEKDDHITKRIIHVTMVSKIARTLGRFLRLNEDLIEAIALGHDVGHCPIGHEGETILDHLAFDYLNEAFLHNVQSVRTYMEIEKEGKGLNLTVQVLDGILCHNGEVLNPIYRPVSKSVEQFLNEYQACLKSKDASYSLAPMTLEGCVVRISDIIAYIGRDIEDAIRLGIIDRNQIPTSITKVLGSTNKEIINTIILDIVHHSYGQPYIKMSSKIYKAIEQLKKFNYEHIYYAANTKESKKKYQIAFTSLFHSYLQAIEEKDSSSSIYRYFLKDIAPSYKKNNSKQRIVLDYIAGMTDDFFDEEYYLIKDKCQQKCVVVNDVRLKK